MLLILQNGFYISKNIAQLHRIISNSSVLQLVKYQHSNVPNSDQTTQKSEEEQQTSPDYHSSPVITSKSFLCASENIILQILSSIEFKRIN